MQTLAIISQKGGAGKTTLAVHLAVAGVQAGKQVGVIDLDPQATATKWSDHRNQPVPQVVSAQAARLEQLLTKARAAETDLVIIDTAPNSDSAALVAARAADLVLIPCRPARFDLDAIAATVELVTLAARPAAVVFNAVPPRGSFADEARAAVSGSGIMVSPCHLTHRAAYAAAVIDGRTAQEYEPDGKAAGEVAALADWIGETVNRLTVSPSRRIARRVAL